MNITSKTDDFLLRIGLHPECIQSDAFKASYMAELKAGLAGEKSSLLMLPTYLSADIHPRKGETAIAVDIGGTNLKIAVLKYENSRFEMIHQNAFPVPGLTEELTKDAFFTGIAKRILPFAGCSDRIGICFSHAAEILPNRDGRLISFSKEIQVKNASGAEIAGEISEKLIRLGVRDKKTYTLLNDGAASLLGGAAVTHDEPSGSIIGFVLGTGMNLSYIEKAEEIVTRQDGYNAETMIVNTETGNFSAMKLGPVDLAFDAGTADPGSHRLEKMTSGRYLGDLIHLALKNAAEYGLLTEPASAAVYKMDGLQTQRAGALLAGRACESGLEYLVECKDDRTVVTTIVDRIFERAAKLAALTVLSVLEKTGAGCYPTGPALVVLEGSTVNKLYSMKDRFIKNMRETGEDKVFKIISPENATLTGTALASFI